MNSYTQLFNGCKNGDLNKVKYLVSQGVNIRADDDWAFCLPWVTPLNSQIIQLCRRSVKTEA